jgi:acid phosphatase type 7
MSFFKLFIRSILVIPVFFISQCTQEIKESAESPKEIFGPYVQRMSDDEVTLCWATIDGETQIGISDSVTQSIKQITNHESIVTGLESDTKYTYDVLNDGTSKGKGTFTTFPEGIVPFHFAVLGDTRTRHDVHQKIVNKIIGENPLFVVNTGDLVSNGNNMSDWEHFFKINDQLMRNTPYYTVLGNHEHDSENYYNFFSMPGKEAYYFFTVGDALFVMLDMEGPHYSAPEYMDDEAADAFWANISIEYMQEEKRWLENLLTLNADAGYIFVFFHPTFYSIKASRVAEAEQRRAFWGDIFERHGVTAVLNGHDHYYHHAMHGGTHYIVTAGGGAPLYDTDAIQPETVKYTKIEHFMRIDVGLNNTKMTAIDINGDTIEEITAERRK